MSADTQPVPARRGIIDLEGLVVVLTGASSGIGEHVARSLHAYGAHLVLGARRRDRLERLAEELDGGPQVTPVACDVTSDDDRAAIIEAAVSHHGRIDGLVNNAGIARGGRALVETVDDVRATLETNLVAPFALSQLAARHMREQGGGSIVNVASVQSFRSHGHMPEAGYVASKAGLVGLSRELASQWGRYNIRVNSVAPGLFVTEMTQGLADDQGELPSWAWDDTPLGRVGAEDEMSGAIGFLLSPASSFVTGQTTIVDGGIATR